MLRKIKIKHRNIRATYYLGAPTDPDDIHLSGVVEILLRGEQIFCREDAGMSDHIEYIEDEISELEEKLLAHKTALVILKRNFEKNK